MIRAQGVTDPEFRQCESGTIRGAFLSRLLTPVIAALFCAFAAPTRASAAKPALVYKNPTLNVLHGLYRDGEFDSLLQAMKAYPDRHPKMNFEDSLFLAKHYAVIFAATPATYERSRYYMRQMLEIDPHSDFVGMFATENVDRLFENVRKEYFLTHIFSPKPDDDSLKVDKQHRSSSQLWWWASGAALIAGGAITLWVINTSNKIDKDTIQTVDIFKP